ncbi:MAG: class I SAM-dependent methyltransferase [Alphaproteobacteria bacterium]|nr:class I SAM-dependent methyltransferase [Alphaproteobacteria bacterium]QQS56318.1 MAG: class I SAM-dependent methyltransferase [Alphaproteobacteria bacterium]
MQPLSFREFEHQFWDKTSKPYDEGLGEVTAQTVPAILQTLKLSTGQTLLDVACGPGYITRSSLGQGIKVTGMDFSSAMIDLAQATFPDQAFQVADAENLPFAENAFDAVSCNFGMMHFSQPEKAIAEAHRVLKNQGRYVFTLWNTPENSPAMNLIFKALKAHAENKLQAPEGPPFFFYAIEDNAFKAFRQSGFKTWDRQVLTCEWPIASAESYVRHFYDGGARIGGTLRAQTPQTLEKIIAHIQNNLVASGGERMYALPVSVVMYSAVK